MKNGNEYSLYFALYRNTFFKDWQSLDGIGVDAKAFLETGFVTAGDASVHKQVPYVITHMESLETGESVFPGNSSCFIQTKWDWSSTSSSNRWSYPFQMYRPRLPNIGKAGEESAYSLISSKHKMRGKGKSFAMRFETEPDKNCRIYGWSYTVNANTIT